MQSTQMDVKEYGYFAGNEWRNAVDNQVFDVHEPYSGFHQGQICLNTRRIIIQRKIYEEFLDKFAARTKSLPAGDPLDPKTIIGPIITSDAVKLIDDRVQEAIASGAKAHTGAKHDGQIYYPTILTDVPLDAAIANEETFGPVVVVEAVDTP